LSRKARLKALWEGVCPGRVKENEPLGPYTTLKIGGPAEWLIEPLNERETERIIALARGEKVPWRVLGQGSNLLVSDKGIKGLVIRLWSREKPRVVRTFSDGGVLVEVTAGYSLSNLVRYGIREGLGGLEFLVGIPGSVGGAWAMNAGSYGRQIGDLTHYLITLSPKGTLTRKGKKDLAFAYRSLDLEPGEIILSGGLKLKVRPREEIRRETKRLWSSRKNTQPWDRPSCGSVFKNPPGGFAARLIEEAGLKGRKKGGAQISEVHANFIVNLGGAKAGDVVALMNRIRRRVWSRFGIVLEPEVKLWGCRLKPLGTAGNR